MLVRVIQRQPNRPSTSGESLFDVFLVMAPSSQESKPPASPLRFSALAGLPVWQSSILAAENIPASTNPARQEEGSKARRGDLFR
jgi:hypothetical protein